MIFSITAAQIILSVLKTNKYLILQKANSYSTRIIVNATQKLSN